MLRLFLLILVGTFVAGCSDGGSGGSGGSDTSDQKSVFSLWARDDMGLAFNLDGQSFNNAFGIRFTVGADTCDCGAIVSGSEASGEVLIGFCTYTGSGGYTDQDCANDWENGGDPYTFLRQGDTHLLLCNDPTVAATCGDYH